MYHPLIASFASRPLARTALLLAASAALGGCQSFGASGPSRGSVLRSAAPRHATSDISVVELNDAAVTRITTLSHTRSFSEVFGEQPATPSLIGRGDVLDIAIWEAPPAVLFTNSGLDGLRGGAVINQGATIPQQMVADDGTVAVPFVGAVAAAGRDPAAVAEDIRQRLARKAHDPQVVVRLVQNETRNVTILGEVAASRRVPLSAKGERLLDAIAAAGGPRQPIGKTTVRLARGTHVAAMPLDAVISDPAQNVRLAADDVVTVLFQPYSFIALGAVTQNAEIPFEGSGLTLAQAMGRIGGLRDDRADVRGIFIFRLEDPAALDPAIAATAKRTNDGRIPVVYRLSLTNAASFFEAQNFTIHHQDVIYVSNAPAVDLQKFLNAVTSVAFSTAGIANLAR